MITKDPYGNRLQRFFCWLTYSLKCCWCKKTYRPFYFWHDIEEHGYRQDQSDIENERYY